MSKTQKHKGTRPTAKRNSPNTRTREKRREGARAPKPTTTREEGGRDPPKMAERQHKQRKQRDRRETTAARQKKTRGGTQTREAAGADTAQDRQPRTLQTSYEPSRPLLDRSLKEAIEGEVLSF